MLNWETFQSEFEKIRTKESPNTDTFYAVLSKAFDCIPIDLLIVRLSAYCLDDMLLKLNWLLYQ